MTDFERWLEEAVTRGEPHALFHGCEVKLAATLHPLALTAQQAMQLAARLIDCAHAPGHPPMHFADGRQPTENERHLSNLLSWRQKEAAEAKEAAAVLGEQLSVATTRAQRFRDALLRLASRDYSGRDIRACVADALEVSVRELEAMLEG